MGYQRRVHGEFYFELYSIIMRNLIALCVASMVGVSTANYYIGHQPMRYYVPQHMYVSQPQVVNLDLDYSPSVAFPDIMHTVHNDGTINSGFGSRSGSLNASEVTGCYTDKELCESNREVRLDCGENSKIKILSANYGRLSTGSNVCPGKNDQVINCIGGSYKVHDYCNNRSRCSLWANNGFFGDPCPDVYKYLFVRMQCVRD